MTIEVNKRRNFGVRFCGILKHPHMRAVLTIGSPYEGGQATCQDERPPAAQKNTSLDNHVAIARVAAYSASVG
jgi:hypothetical protein